MNVFSIEILGYEFAVEIGRVKKPPAPPASERKTAEQIAADKATTHNVAGGQIGFAAQTRDITPGHNRWEPNHWQDGNE